MKIARDALKSGDRDLAEQKVWELCEVFERDYQVASAEEYTPEIALLQYQCMDVMFDLHLMRGNPMDLAIRLGNVMKKLKDDVEHCKNWSENDIKPIVDLVLGMYGKLTDFNTKGMHGERTLKVRDASCLCELCKKNLADKTGSHMVPHFLIARVFSYDGSADRDKVVVEVANLANGKNDRYFGHNVYDDTVNELLGRSFTDEEVEEESIKSNALTLDHVFCSECEKRLGVIESYYSEILSGTSEYPPHIPYLFWISVVWRMAVGEFGMVMHRHHQEKLRTILNSCLALKREEIVHKPFALQHCAYSLYLANETKDETLGILGTYEVTIPYQALIGKILINFYVDSKVAYRFVKRNHLPLEDLNNGTGKERIGELSFAEFWLAKRQILDLAWKNGRSVWNIGYDGNKTLTKFEKRSRDLQDALGSEYDEDAETIPTWISSDNPFVVTIPRAIKKIMAWSNSHPEYWSIEQMSKDLDYSKEELAVMLSYWQERSKEYEKRIGFGEQLGKFLDEVL